MPQAPDVEVVSPTELQRRLFLLKYQKAVLAARDSVDAFSCLVTKTETGDHVEVGDIHRVMTDFVHWTWKKGYYAGILAPFGHGKTTMCVISRTLWELGRSPEIRIKIISATEEVAKDRVASIRKYIEFDPDYQAVFPNIKPARVGDWGAYRIYVERTSYALDPSVEAKGLFTAGTGGRSDLLIFDDVIDYNNTIKQPAMIPMAYDAINSVWLKRKESWSRVVMIGTAWHSMDAYHKLRRVSSRWKWLIIRVSDDFTKLECEVEG